MNYLIESERLFLRSFNIEDVEEFYQMTRDKLIYQYLCYHSKDTLNEFYELVEYYIKSDDFYLVIEEKKSGHIIGTLFANHTLKNKIEISYMISRNFRKKGYMSEALSAFIKSVPSGFTLDFYIDANNIASIKTVQKIRGIKELKFNIKTENAFRAFSYEC